TRTTLRGRQRPADRGRAQSRNRARADAVLFVLHAINWILLPFVLSGVVAYVCSPLANRLARSLRLPRTLVAIAIFVVLVAAAAAVVALGISPLTDRLSSIVTDFSGTIEG